MNKFNLKYKLLTALPVILLGIVINAHSHDATQGFESIVTSQDHGKIRAFVESAKNPLNHEDLIQQIMAPSEFVEIPAGEVNVNRSDDLQNSSQFNLESFRGAKFKVSQLLWYLIMKDENDQTIRNPSRFKTKEYCEIDYIELEGTPLCALHPVENVSLKSIKTQFLPKLLYKLNKPVRVLTEPEWEALAGKIISSGIDPYLFAWLGENSVRQTQQLGLKSANENGIYDILGNTQEWIDEVIDTPFSRLKRFKREMAVIRGCNYSTSALKCDLTHRDGFWPQGSSSEIGFRLAITNETLEKIISDSYFEEESDFEFGSYPVSG